MNVTHFRGGFYIFVSISLLLFSTYSLASPALWVNGSGTYSTAANWDIDPDVPCNASPPPPSYEVTVPASSGTITVDLDCTVNTLSLGANNTLVNSGVVSFTSGSPSVADDALIQINGGAHFSIGLSSYSTQNLPTTYTVLSATAINTILDLPLLTSINAGFDDASSAARRHYVSATNGGQINMPAVTQLLAPQRLEDFLEFDITGLSNVNLNAVQTIGDDVTNLGYVYFNLNRVGSDAPTLDLPALTSAKGALFYALNGSTINANSTAWTYSSAHKPVTLTMFSSSGVDTFGAGSMLDFSALTSLNAGFNDATTAVHRHYVSATTGGQIDLSGLTEMIPPVRSEDYLEFDITGSSNINLDALQTIGDDVTNLGYVYFNLNRVGSDAPILDLPMLTTAKGGLFYALNGSKINANSSSWTYSSAHKPITLTLFSSSGVDTFGVGSVLDFSGLTSLDAGFNDASTAARRHYVSATTGGQIDLSGLTEMIPPVRTEDYLEFDITGSSNINLNSLQTIGDDVSNLGYVYFNLNRVGSDKPTLDLPVLSAAKGALFYALNGSRINANASAWTYSAAHKPINLTLFSSSGVDTFGVGSMLDFSALTSLDAGFNDASTAVRHHYVSATTGGDIDLSGLTEMIPPVRTEDYLEFDITGSSSVNLNALQTIGDDVNNLGYVYFSLNRVGTDAPTLDFPLVSSVKGGLFYARNGSTINMNTIPWTYSSAHKPVTLTLFSSSGVDTFGVGSMLDFSALTSLDAGFNDASTAAHRHYVSATTGGDIDLSGLTQMIPPVRTEDYLEFDITGSSNVNLSALQTIGDDASNLGYVYFDLNRVGTDIAVLDLPAVNTVKGGLFYARNGSQINMNTIPWTYSSAHKPVNLTIFYATGMDTFGNGSLLDFSALTSLDVGFNDASTAVRRHYITLENGGDMDLSGVTSIIAPVRAEDYLQISVGNNTNPSELIVGSLSTISGGGRVLMYLNRPQSSLTAPGDLLPASKLELYAPAAAEGTTISVAGDFEFSHTDDATFQLQYVKVHMNGSGVQHLEAPTLDEGVAADPLTLNLELGQLYIGQSAQATEVHLSDVFDNDGGFDICGSGEALYLVGLANSVSEPDGLYIKGGSTLYLDSRNVYANIAGSLQSIRDMLGGNECITFDEGQICQGTHLELRDYDQDGVADIIDNCPLVANGPSMPDAGGNIQYDVDGDGYGNICDPDFDNNLVINAIDLGYMKTNFFTTDPLADLNGNGFVNGQDLGILKQKYFGAPGPSCVAPAP